MMLKMIAIPFLFVILGAVLAFNGFLQMVQDGYRWVVAHALSLSAVGCFALLIFTAGCTRQDVQTSLAMTRLGANATGLVNAWDGDRQILEKYRDALPEESADYLALDDVISGGDGVQKELALLVIGSRVPSVAGLQAIFKESDRSVVAGASIYHDYIEHVSFSDRMRAQEFGITWANIKLDLAALTEATASNERYQMAQEILSFALTVTGQLVIPALQANGKL